MPRVHRLGVKAQGRVRLVVQLAATVIANGYAAGFATGKLFNGPTKGLCVPMLNCYSCPGALGGCPLGSLQTALGSNRPGMLFYVLGFLMLFGIVLGRLICGFLCPIGLVQDLLYRIPTPKLSVPRRIDRPLRYLKYVVLALCVVVVPFVAFHGFGAVLPFFCEFLCPAGTLEVGIPLAIADPAVRSALGILFDWRVILLVAILVASVLVRRPFCKYLCPLGAFYALFNRFSIYRYEVDAGRCTGCGTCARGCPMQVDVAHDANSPECIRCGKCKAACPAQAISSGLTVVKSPETGTVAPRPDLSEADGR